MKVNAATLLWPNNGSAHIASPLNQLFEPSLHGSKQGKAKDGTRTKYPTQNWDFSRSRVLPRDIIRFFNYMRSKWPVDKLAENTANSVRRPIPLKGQKLSSTAQPPAQIPAQLHSRFLSIYKRYGTGAAYSATMQFSASPRLRNALLIANMNVRPLVNMHIWMWNCIVRYRKRIFGTSSTFVSN